LFIDITNVSSKQIAEIRMELRKISAVMIVGKNTLMRKSLTALNTKPLEKDADFAARGGANWEKNENIEKILAQLRGNTNIIFTRGDLSEIK